MKVFRAKEVKGGEAALDFGQFNPNPHLTLTLSPIRMGAEREQPSNVPSLTK